MKLFWCCLIAALMTISRGAVDVERTVKQVQSILQANSQLPRLTRDDIIQLLNDIRAEDAKKTGSKESKESKEDKKEVPYSTIENEINPATHTPNVVDNEVSDAEASPENAVETTTKKSEPTLMVVLPYTPRDGASLQELYTRPPRIEVVRISSTTLKPKTTATEKPQDPIDLNAKETEKQKDSLPEELQAFLDAHGLKGKPGQDNFLLPLDGFKPLPPAQVIDGTVQLPENLLLTYDLISPNSDSKTNIDAGTPNNFLYEPLRPELPFELDTSSSETKETSFPYDMPKSHKTKATPNYEPIDYDSVKVIPLKKHINPVNEPITTSNEQSKRQATSEASTSATIDNVETTTVTEAPKTNEPPASDSASADSDAGASIADLEDSFGGAAPSQPGDSELPPPRKNGFYWMVDWNSFLEVGDGDTKVNIRFEPKLGDPQMFLPVSVP